MKCIINNEPKKFRNFLGSFHFLYQSKHLFRQELAVDVGNELITVAVADGYFSVITQRNAVLANFLNHFQVYDIRTVDTHEGATRQALFHLFHAK